MYKVTNPIDKAFQGMGNAANSYGSMMKDIPANRDPGPSAGGAAMSGLSGAATGAAIGSAVPGIGTAVGAAAGAVIGIGSYLLS